MLFGFVFFFFWKLRTRFRSKSFKHLNKHKVSILNGVWCIHLYILLVYFSQFMGGKYRVHAFVHSIVIFERYVRSGTPQTADIEIQSYAHQYGTISLLVYFERFLTGEKKEEITENPKSWFLFFFLSLFFPQTAEKNNETKIKYKTSGDRGKIFNSIQFLPSSQSIHQ